MPACAAAVETAIAIAIANATAPDGAEDKKEENEKMKKKKNNNNNNYDNNKDMEASLELSSLEAAAVRPSDPRKQQHRSRRSKTTWSSSSTFTTVAEHYSNCNGNGESVVSTLTSGAGTGGANRSVDGGGKSFVTTVDASVATMISIARGEEKDPEELLERERGRKSSIWCFFVCDLVTASVVMNLVFVVLMVFMLVISLTDNENFGLRIRLYLDDDDDDDDYYSGLYYGDDDETTTTTTTRTKDDLDPWSVVRYSKIVTGLVFALIGTYGAVTFRISWVFANAVFQTIYILLSLFNRRWIGTFLTVPFAYTSFHLWFALRKGTIAAETYRATERHCCCCFSRRRRSDDDDDDDDD